MLGVQGLLEEILDEMKEMNYKICSIADNIEQIHEKMASFEATATLTQKENDDEE